MTGVLIKEKCEQRHTEETLWAVFKPRIRPAQTLLGAQEETAC